MTQTNCTECHKRALMGPNYDARRGTGRTTHSMKNALIAAAFGHRVLFVSGNHSQAEDICAQARRLLSQEINVSPDSCTATRINFPAGGYVEFRSMNALDSGGSMLTKPEHAPTQVLWDHHATEKLAEQKARKERMDDAQTIHSLMRKHGWTEAVTHGSEASKCELK